MSFSSDNYVSFFGVDEYNGWDYPVTFYYVSKTVSDVSVMMCWFPNQMRSSQDMGKYNWLFLGY